MPASVFMASPLRRNPFIGSGVIELQSVEASSKLISSLLQSDLSGFQSLTGL
ncbi:MAG TPA: hypothetical protein VMT76_13495 [Puia sp.]|nr:hypothetical protein [Puia sp.]